jgi:DNA-binding NarL/FixJ family response regulator
MVGHIRVLLADDSEFVRNAIRSLLSTEQAIVVIGQAGNYAELICLCKKDPPDVIVMDLHMPDERQFQAECIKRELRGSCLLAISVWDSQETVELARRYGAVQLLDKGNLAATLIPAIQECIQEKVKGSHV